MEIQLDSIELLALSGGDRLHLKHFFTASDGPVSLLLHGSIENGRIFYSRSLKGFAPYLAQAGFQVYVLDWRGRGGSLPPIGRGSKHGQWESINEDLPQVIDFLLDRHKLTSLSLITHSWGGVLVNSFLVRHPTYLAKISRMVHWGTKRSVGVKNWAVFWKIRVFWERLARVFLAVYGYLPAREWGGGADNESRLSLLEGAAWTKAGSLWVDPRDGFDYSSAAQKVSLPRTLYMVGGADRDLGHPEDVDRFRQESQHLEGSEVVHLSPQHGFQRNYGHIDMLTHPQARGDHFPQVLNFLRGEQ